MPELFTYTLDCEKDYKPGICFFEGSKQMEDFEKYKSIGNAQFQAVVSVASLKTCLPSFASKTRICLPTGWNKD